MKLFYRVFLLAPLLTLGQTILAEAPSGYVIGWGCNVAGDATGIPSTGTDSSTGLVRIAGEVLTNVIDVQAGRSHGLALRGDGTVVGWGGNNSGEAVGYTSEYPHRASGPVKVLGKELTGITRISAGGGFSLAIKTSGRVVTWGEGLEYSKSGDLKPPPALTNVIGVAAGWNYAMALKRDGTVVGWGGRKIPEGLSNIIAVAAGGGFYAPGLALKESGEVVQWTTGGAEEPVPPQVTNIVAIAAGEAHSLAVRRDGTVFGWGANQFGQATGRPTVGFPSSSNGPVILGGLPLTNVAAVAAGHEFSVALKRDGTVVAWGYNGFHQTNVPAGLSNVVAIAAGDNFCLALTTNSSALSPQR